MIVMLQVQEDDPSLEGTLIPGDRDKTRHLPADHWGEKAKGLKIKEKLAVRNVDEYQLDYIGTKLFGKISFLTNAITVGNSANINMCSKIFFVISCYHDEFFFCIFHFLILKNPSYVQEGKTERGE